MESATEDRSRLRSASSRLSLLASEKLNNKNEISQYKRSKSCPPPSRGLTFSIPPQAARPILVVPAPGGASRLDQVTTYFGTQMLNLDVAQRPRIPKDSSSSHHAFKRRHPCQISKERQDGTPIFENEFFVVDRTEDAGWGAFARKTLQQGEHILIERPLFQADCKTILGKCAQMSQQDRKVAMSLHAHFHDQWANRMYAVWATNSFATVGRYGGLFPVAARFNHACAPVCNVNYAYDDVNDVLVMSVTKDVVEAGEELRITYGKNPFSLYLSYGFRCNCGACAGITDEQADAIDNQRYASK